MTKSPMLFLRGLRRWTAIAALGVVVFAGPAVAQPSPEFTIGGNLPSLNVPEGVGDLPDPREPLAFGRKPAAPAASAEAKRECFSNRQVRRGLRGHDFDNIEIGKVLRGDTVEVHANYGGSLYRMVLDRCTGKVSNVEKVGRNRLGGFGLQFGF